MKTHQKEQIHGISYLKAPAFFGRSDRPVEYSKAEVVEAEKRYVRGE
jgi:hypothetical protein